MTTVLHEYDKKVTLGCWVSKFDVEPATTFQNKGHSDPEAGKTFAVGEEPFRLLQSHFETDGLSPRLACPLLIYDEAETGDCLRPVGSATLA